jgi:2-polyprenyl-6-methoxyphenol hydroxylase-like FAD-dependent oxidoreductase
MNTGMQDACNLAWKLALVFAGHLTSDSWFVVESEEITAKGNP